MSQSVTSSYLQSLYNKITLSQQDPAPVSVQEKDIKDAMQAYAAANPDATVADFEQAFKASKGAKAAALLNNVVLEMLPAGAEPAGTALSAVDGATPAAAAAGASKSDDGLVWNQGTHSLVDEKK